MTRFFYSLVLYALLPVVVLRLLWRSRRAPAYRRRWPERFGFVPPLTGSRVIWVHSVSVGETLAAVPMVRRLLADFPDHQLVVTTMTPTGSECVRAAFGDRVYHVYAPYDLPDAVRRFLDRVNPELMVVMETELWPNCIAICDRRDIPVIVANARLSARSAAGYRRFAPLVRPMLKGLSQVAAQTVDDGQRFIDLGLERSQLAVTGNIKFDLTISPGQRRRASELSARWRGPDERPVLLAASTHRGEDEIVLDAFEQLLEHFPSLLLVLVPRHPERFGEVWELIRGRGLSAIRRSDGQVPAASDQVVLGDTMGELALFCGACDIVFVGGSLVPVGGHNLIEPAAWGVPVLSGPELFNFTEVARLLTEADALAICRTAPELSREVGQLLADDERRRERGRRALGVAEANRGAMERLLTLIGQRVR
ncbi:MAG: 3-deoxy-D-manno-octulosonic acid transferase [Porticoccaceae bacterium]|nr:3-deoxy-D-manno-octulosonic acid transferase [Porticoccaceae bacterium]